MTPTVQMTLKFDAFKGADENGSSVDGTMALAVGGEHKLTIPNTKTGTSFTSMLKQKIWKAYIASVASEIVKIYARSMIASVSGKTSVSQIPVAGDKQ